MVAVALLLVGFVLLVKGAGLLVDGASAFARAMRVSDLAIGLTIVAFGTSAPELVVNVFASAEGRPEIAIGNIIGSNTFNILVILGISSLLRPLAVSVGTVWKEIPFALLAAVTVGILANDALLDGAAVSELTRSDGIVLLLFFGIFLYYMAALARHDRAMQRAEGGSSPPSGLLKPALAILGGLVALAVGAKWVVDGSVQLAAMLGVSQSLIALTIVAGGTSLPELATSVVAARRGNADLAVGNIVGSNIFNVFFILGTSAVIRPLPFASSSNVDAAVMIGATALLFLTMFTGGLKHHIERWEGALFLLLYAGYLAFLIVRS